MFCDYHSNYIVKIIRKISVLGDIWTWITQIVSLSQISHCATQSVLQTELLWSLWIYHQCFVIKHVMFCIFLHEDPLGPKRYFADRKIVTRFVYWRKCVLVQEGLQIKNRDWTASKRLHFAKSDHSLFSTVNHLLNIVPTRLLFSDVSVICV